MRVASVSFGYTKNMGNYESMRVDVTVELREDESSDQALLLASGIVKEALGMQLDRQEGEVVAAERQRVFVAKEQK